MKTFTKYRSFILVFFLFTTSYISAQDSSKYHMYVGSGNVNLEFGMKYQFNSVESQFGIKSLFAWGLESNVFYSLIKTSHFRHQIGLSGGVLRYNLESESGLFKFISRAPNPQNERVISFYLGPIYQLTWKDFYFKTSILIGNKNFIYPRLFYSIGYNFSF
ncbi:MAG: hypothetical protein Q8N03_08730 [Ignavibacteria bacterium]|nr:hypothetical protein [Ignavibacteria bacterium]